MNTTIQSCNLALNSQMIIKNASMKGNIYTQEHIYGCMYMCVYIYMCKYIYMGGCVWRFIAMLSLSLKDSFIRYIIRR